MRLGWLILGLGIVIAILVGAALGAYGPLVTCGADQAALCVAWPGLVSGATWLVFVAFFVGLAAWQVREWRRSAGSVAPDEHVAEDR